MTHWRREFDFVLEWTTHVVEALDHAIDAAWARAVASHDALGDLETIEHIVGIGVIAIQVYVREVPTIIEQSNGRHHHPLKLAGLYGDVVPNVELRDIEILWHLANYVKHHDEWETKDRTWPDEPTQKALRRLGIGAATEQPCVEGLSKILGDHVKLGPLLERASRWRERCFLGEGLERMPEGND